MPAPSASPPPGAQKLPWGPGAEITTNQAIGSLRESVKLWLTTERGIHSETLLLTIGAIAGFAGQCAAIDRIVKKEPFPADAFLQMTTKSGEIFLMGDLINGYLVPQRWSEYPLWGFLRGAAADAGIQQSELPDTGEMFSYIASQLGAETIKVPRLPPGNGVQLQPRQALEIFWPRAKHIFTRTDGPGTNGANVPVKLWPVVANVVANQFVVATKDVVNPRLSVRIVMETAILASKINPKTVPQTLPPSPAKQ
jgi:hypothetical protein